MRRTLYGKGGSDGEKNLETTKMNLWAFCGFCEAASLAPSFLAVGSKGPLHLRGEWPRR